MSHNPNDAHSHEIEERRARVAAFRLAGVRDQRRIAEQLNVSQPTISRDFAVLDAQFRDAATRDVGEAKALDLERVEAMFSGVWGDARRGNYGAVDRALRLLERKSKVLGYDAPAKVDITAAVREMALERGLDPEEAIRAAEQLVRRLLP